ncbi:MAG: hypothetical protein WBD86_00920 [Microgenomates group bacterium]
MAVLLSPSKKSFLPSGAKVLLVPILILVLVIILSVVVFRIGISRINSQRKELQVAEKNERVFTQKQQVLQQIEGNVLSYADVSSIAMPEKNPVLTVIAQLKSMTETKLVTLNDLKVGNEVKDKEGLSKAIISFEIEGELGQVMDYLISTRDFAPLSVTDKINITQAAGAIRASVDLVTFWVPFPTKLPPMSEAVRELSAEELSLITQLSGLQQPVFIEISPMTPSARTDPFSF